MKYTFLLILGIGTFGSSSAQTKHYFQQETNYRIQVTLDDRQHTLSGMMDLTYINHAPEALPYIWFHLWPNAYRGQTTAFAKQQVRWSGTEFYFAKDRQLGYIDSLDFSVNGQTTKLEYDPENPDLAKLWLPQPLASADSIRIRTPFFVKIPDSFSRLGHVGQSYQITQWYPKPAVYDAAGWHPMPYLDQGEFYSEFGSFDVRITLPANYVVGATGQLQTPEEKAFLLSKAAETRAIQDSLVTLPNEGYVFEAFPASDPRNKTIRFTAGQVHDFAWFADKRFRVQHDSVQLSSGRSVATWTMFTATEAALWQRSIDYVNRSVLFYSRLLGDYPYPQVTAIQSALSAGGGMEYPMITVIDLAGTARSLDEVITHEVGHNWFYGVLASDERRHPWLDEGLNSFYEERYMQTYYPPPGQSFLPGFLVGSAKMDLAELLYLLQARRRQDQDPDTPSEDFSDINYWLGAYYKPAKALWWLYHYWGEEKFDRVMQDYYATWRFRHPQPADLMDILKKYTDQDLDWFSEGLIASNTHFDYALKSFRRSVHGQFVTLENRGDWPAPIPLQGIRNGATIFTQWLPGFTGTKEWTLPPGNYDQLVIDQDHQTLDINRKNNQIKTSGAFKKWSLFRLVPLARIENEEYTSLFTMPFAGWNQYDGLQLGVLLHNRTLPYKKLEFDLLPLYGFRSKSFNGIGNLDYHFYPATGLLSEIGLGLNFRFFHFQENLFGNFRYQRWEPHLRLELRQPLSSPFRHRLRYRLIRLNQESLLQRPEDGTFEKVNNGSVIHELAYKGANDRQLHPFQYQLTLEQQAYEDVFGDPQHYLKWSVDWRSHLHYAEDKRVRFRLFVGGFFQNTRRKGGAIFPGAFSLIDQAATDYRYDDFYFGRSEREGFLIQQLARRDGGFKVPVSPAFNLGKSNNFIAAVNVTSDLPFGYQWPLRLFFDLGYFNNAMPTASSISFRDQMMWSGGLALEILEGRVGVYFPLINAKNIQDRLIENGNYWKRISFRFDLYGEDLRKTLEANW